MNPARDIPIWPAVLIAAVVFAVTPRLHAQQSDADDQIWVTDEDADHGEQPMTTQTISKLVKRVSPAVVNIIVAYKGNGFSEMFDGEGPPLPGPEGGIGQGSGFVIHPDGYVLTNYHVVENAKSIRVRRKDQTEYEATVVGVDPKTDIALLDIETDEKLPVLPLGDSDDWEVGDYVVAIGNPLGLEHTVTSGIISALGRRNLGIQGDDLYTDFIQIDVSINPGNSGGPLVGLTGEVIGINTAINRKGQGIGFAIPINMIKTLLPQLEQNGYVTRSWLGARVQKITPELAESFGLDEPQGALITEVVDESPAAKAGLQTGDIIVEFDDRPVRTSDQLSWMVASIEPGKTTRLQLVRGGERRSLDIELAEHPDQSRPDLPASEGSSSETTTERSTDLEVQVKNLTDSLARQLGAGSRSGVVVTDVGEDSAAKSAGLRRRDVITEIDQTPIDSATDFESTIQKYASGEVVRLKLVRGGRVVYIAFER